MRSQDPVRRHTLGVYIAGALLIATVALAVIIGGALLFNIGTSKSHGAVETAAASSTSAPVSHLALPATTPPPVVHAPGGALCVGDSVMQAASPRYYNVLTMCGVVDAAVSRQWGAAAAVIRAHSPYPAAVVIHMGTNGFTNPAEVDSVLSPLTHVRRVVLVTVQLNGTRRWEASENAEIAAAATRWPNVRVADWKAVSDGHPEYFRPDHIHPTRPGALAYAGVIAQAL
jgi:hypothetical protein